MTYTERIKACKLPTLHYRHIRGDMIMYKILSWKYDTAVIPRVSREYSSINRGNDLRLQQEGQHPLTGQRAANFRLLYGQPVSRTEASDAMTSRLPRYEAKCVQRRCFQCGSVPLRSHIKGTELPPANILIPLERQLIALQPCRSDLLYNETLQQTFRPLLSKLSKKRQI